MVLLQDVEGRTPPAKVYPACEGADEWVVEGPISHAAASSERKTFTGANALTQALAYAHSAYGSAQYLSR